MKIEEFERSVEKEKRLVKTCNGCGEEVPVPSEDQHYRATNGEKCDSCFYDDFPMVAPIGRTTRP